MEYTEDTVTMNMKVVCGITALVLIGGIAYVYLYPQNPTAEPQATTDTLSEAQKAQILGEVASNPSMSDAEKTKLLESLKK